MKEDLLLKLPKIHFGGDRVSRSRFLKFFEILIDENLKWNTQIKAIETKISTQIS